MTEPSQPADSNQPHSAQPAESNQPDSPQPTEPHQQTPQAPAFGSQPQSPPPAPGQMPPPPPQGYAGQPLQPGQPMHHGGFPAHQQPAAVMPIYTRKDPGVMLLASFFIPGLGSMLSERIGKGLGILIAFFISCLLMSLLIGFLMAPIVWILGLVAAFQDAKDWNRAHGFPE